MVNKMDKAENLKIIKIIADDLGLDESVNQAIVSLLKEKAIDGASLMANGQAFEDALVRIRELNFESNIGAHLVLVGEKSILGGDLNPDYKVFFIKYLLGKINFKNIEDELRAQLKKIVDAGIQLRFLNSHQHLHLLPKLGLITIKLAKEFNIPYIRTVSEPFYAGSFFRRVQLILLRYFSSRLTKRIKANNLQTNDCFAGFLKAGSIGLKDLEKARELARKNPSKIVELNCHPGFENPELRGRYKWGYSWEAEYNLLIDESAKKILYCSSSRLKHSVNSVYIKALKTRGLGLETYFIKRSLSEYLFFIKKVLTTEADIIMIGYDSPKLVILASLLSDKKIVYNALCSVYERLVVSRGLTSRFSLRPIYYWLLDFFAVHLADVVMLETNNQINYFKKLFGGKDSKYFRAWTGVDEENFFFIPSLKKFDKFTVVFRGMLVPEAGAEQVIYAAKKLEDLPIDFIMAASGQLLARIEKLISDLKPKNLKIIKEFQSFDSLRELVQRSHLSLGQLSNHSRLTRTIPHKAFESFAMKVPYLTANNPGIMELLESDKTCITCEPANTDSIIEKIKWAYNNYSEVQKIAENASILFERELRTDILAERLLKRII